MWSVWLVFCDCGFHSVCPLMDKDKRFLMGETDWGANWVLFWWAGPCSVNLESNFLLMGKAVPSLLFDPRPNSGGGDENNGDLLQKVPSTHFHTQCPWPCSRPPPTHTSMRDSWTLTGKSGSVSFGVTAPLSWVLVHKVLCVPSRVCFPSPVWVLAAPWWG